MTAEGPPPPGRPPLEPDESPATVGQLRTLRRWVTVAGVWAVAATAVALIALLDDGGNGDSPDDDRRVAADIGELQRSLDERLGELERRLRDGASADDLRRLDRRLQELEDAVSSASDAASDASDAADGLGRRVDELEGRIEALESAAGGGGGDGGEQP